MGRLLGPSVCAAQARPNRSLTVTAGSGQSRFGSVLLREGVDIVDHDEDDPVETCRFHLAARGVIGVGQPGRPPGPGRREEWPSGS